MENRNTFLKNFKAFMFAEGAVETVMIGGGWEGRGEAYPIISAYFEYEYA